MKGQTPVKFAIIGFGRIGKRHARMIEGNPEAELVAICETNINPKEELSIPVFGTLKELIDSPLEIDVTIIATPTGLHAEQSIEALAAGFHVVVEKPLSLSKTDAERVIHKALAQNRHVFVVMQNRYSPASVLLKGLVDSNKLGKINLVQVNCFWNRDERYYKPGSWHGNQKLDGGTLFTQFSHFVDTLYWLFGDIENIHSRMTNFNHGDLVDFEDTGIVTFNFSSGAMGVINFSTSAWDQNFESSIAILGEKGTIRVGGQYMDTIQYAHIKDHNIELEEHQSLEKFENHALVIQNVIDVLKGKGAITTNALEGLKVVDMIERIYNKS